MPVKRRHAGGLHRVLGTAALFSTAYGNVGSSIYYALGLVTAYALGLTPVAFFISGAIFFFTQFLFLLWILVVSIVLFLRGVPAARAI